MMGEYKWHVILVAIGAGFTVSTVGLLLHFHADLLTSLVGIGAFVTTVGALFVKQLGAKKEVPNANGNGEG